MKPPSSVAVHVQHFDFPAFGFGVMLVHFVQVAGKQGRFVAASAGANLHHHAGALRIFAADGHFQQLVPDIFALLSQLGQFGFGHFSQLKILALDHRLRLGDLPIERFEAAILLGQAAERAVLARSGGDLSRIAQHVGVDELPFQIFEAGQFLFEHFAQRHGSHPLDIWRRQ